MRRWAACMRVSYSGRTSLPTRTHRSPISRLVLRAGAAPVFGHCSSGSSVSSSDSCSSSGGVSAWPIASMAPHCSQAGRGRRCWRTACVAIRLQGVGETTALRAASQAFRLPPRGQGIPLPMNSRVTLLIHKHRGVVRGGAVHPIDLIALVHRKYHGSILDESRNAVFRQKLQCISPETENVRVEDVSPRKQPAGTPTHHAQELDVASRKIVELLISCDKLNLLVREPDKTIIGQR